MLTVTATGFRTFKQELSLAVGHLPTLDISMAVGAVSETVEVTENATQVARHYTASGRKFPTLGMLRASTRKQTSWPFSLKRPPNRYVLAFG